MPTVLSSHGEFTVGNNGLVRKKNMYSYGEWTNAFPVYFNFPEYKQYHGKIHDTIDILDIGYIDDQGEYVPPEGDFRAWQKGNEKWHKEQECATLPLSPEGEFING